MRKSIFITGGASGIGRAIAGRFALEGWRIGVGDLDQAGMDETLSALEGDGHFTHVFDVTDRAAWDEALSTFAVHAGQVDVIVNNAGIPLGGAIGENSEAEITRCLDVNLKGALFGAQAAYPYLQASAPGSCLLSTASAAGIWGSPGTSVYAATKAGVRAMTESLDGEWRDDGIKVRSLCPSFIDTPLLDHAPNAGANEMIRQRVIDAGLEITPVSEVANAAWRAVHGKGLHQVIGKTAKRMEFARRFTPGRLRKLAAQVKRPMGR